MRAIRLAIVGFGRLGKACIRVIRQDEQATLAGVVRGMERLAMPLSDEFQHIRTAGHISELGPVDAALICVPTDFVQGVAQDVLQDLIPIVECAGLHGDEFEKHKHELDRIASRHKVPAVVGAGWNPGALSMIRGLFALLTPKGHTHTTHRPGISLHHTTLARSVMGVKEALATELRSSHGKPQHYVYVELEQGASIEAVDNAIRSDPMYLDEEIYVFAVDSIAELEEQGHGVLLERRGSAGFGAHQLLLLEGRFSEQALAAQVMVAAARALPHGGHRAYSLYDLPLGSLWGELRARAEKEWI
jgi:diaminopimelate dehydrogenase